MIDANPGDEMGWFWRLGDLPEMPHAAPPVAGAGAARVPGGVQELPRPALPGEEPRRVEEQARRLRRHARDPAQGLRRQAAAGAGARRRRPASSCWPSAARRSPTRSPQGEQAGDGVAFADAKELDLLAAGRRRCAAAIDAPGAEAEVTALRDRVRLAARPAVVAARQEADRPRLGAAEGPAAHRRRAGRGHARATPRSPRRRRRSRLRFDRFGRRIAALDAAAQRDDPARRRARAASSRSAVQDIAVAQLTRQQERLAEYTTQARFAVAQLYDRAYANKEPERAAGQALSRARRLRTALLLAAACVAGGVLDVRQRRRARPTTSRP